MVLADDRMPADRAYKLACEGTALLWQGDFQNARHLLQALMRRLDRQPPRRSKAGAQPDTPAQAFHRHRQQQGRAHILGMLLIPFNADHTIPLRRAPDVQQACLEAYGPGTEPYVTSLRELLGSSARTNGAKGRGHSCAQGRIHAHYGVFSPLRGEYIDLVAQALAAPDRSGVRTSAPAAACWRRCWLSAGRPRHRHRPVGSGPGLRPRQPDASGKLIQVELQRSISSPGRAPLVVCNPPWVPARPTSPVSTPSMTPTVPCCVDSSPD